MRGWTILLLVLVFAFALWLLREGVGGASTGPVAAVPSERASIAGPPPLDGQDRAGDGRVSVALPPIPSELPAAPATEHLDTRLIVRAFLPHGAPWVGGTVELSGRERPIEAGAVVKRDRSQGNVSTFSVSGRFDGTSHGVFQQTDEQGRVDFESVVPGLVFQVRAVDRADGVGASAICEPMAAGESRELDLWLDEAPAPLRGRCVDAAGSPLVGVSVHVAGGHLGLILTTDEFGRFETLPIFPRDVSVTAELDGHVAAQVGNWCARDAPIELMLLRGRGLTVEFVDDRGDPITNLGVSLHVDADGPPIGIGHRVVGDALVFDALPPHALTLRWGHGCSPHSVAVDVETEHLSLRAQRPGEVAVQMAKLPGDSTSSTPSSSPATGTQGLR